MHDRGIVYLSEAKAPGPSCLPAGLASASVGHCGHGGLRHWRKQGNVRAQGRTLIISEQLNTSRIQAKNEIHPQKLINQCIRSVISLLSHPVRLCEFSREKSK